MKSKIIYSLLVIVSIACIASISYGYGIDKGKSRVLHIITEKTVEIPTVEYVDRVIIETVTETVTITENVTEYIDRPIYPELRYFNDYSELLNWFYQTEIDPIDCDKTAEAAQHAATKAGFIVNTVIMEGYDYNKIFIDYPIPPSVLHAFNFTWTGNDGYYIDFLTRNIKKADFVRD